MINQIMPLILWATPVLACANEVICDIEYAGSVTSIKPEANNDPYQFTNIDLQGGFRFSAQLLPELNKLKTYVYHQSKNRYVLIQAAEYGIEQKACLESEHRFGLNKVYSAQLERELLFQCRLSCR
ncbi:MAG: hypothetical protein HOP04_10300 [Methylophilaceae bacterium]|nr:hypothetical protein [Methylophilaceae bacterium]